MFPLLESITKRHNHKFLSNFIFTGVVNPRNSKDALNEDRENYVHQDSDEIHQDHTSPMNKHVSDYTSTHHYDINKTLINSYLTQHGGDQDSKKQHKKDNHATYTAIDHLTSHIDKHSNIKYPFYVYTAVKFDVARTFLEHGDGSILTYHHPAFTSASTKIQQTTYFARNFIYTTNMVQNSPFSKLHCTGAAASALLDLEEKTKQGINTHGIAVGHVLRIKMPNHGKAISVKSSTEHKDEDEILIQRNLDIKIHGHPVVVKSNEHSRKFYFIWDAEYVGHTMMDV